METAAAYSALAAGLSAIVSVLLWRIESFNRKDAVRPEVILETLQNGDESNRAFLTVGKIRNAGRGHAFGVQCRSQAFGYWDHKSKNLELWPSRAPSIQFLDSGGQMGVEWRHVAEWAPFHAGKIAIFDINVECDDAHGRKYEFNFELFLTTTAGWHPAATKLAEGLYLTGRSSRLKPSTRVGRFLTRVFSKPASGLRFKGFMLQS